ncbi:molybdopterin dinucleotide binding domain-containing protein [Streptomyces sp. NPDC002676]
MRTDHPARSFPSTAGPGGRRTVALPAPRPPGSGQAVRETVRHAGRASQPRSAQLTVESRHGKARLIARISEQTVPGQVFYSFPFPASGLNRLTSVHADTVMSRPEHKVTAVRLAAR